MHPYRTHTCGELREDHIDQTVRLSGWIHRKRDHGSLLFVDLRDHYGLTQCVIDTSDSAFSTVESLRNESVVTITGSIPDWTEWIRVETTALLDNIPCSKLLLI